ncbi:MAG: hypothetical protein A9Z00_03970 [Thermobacillus sp. ZCTH02-B1]|uniref:hypothetical protein n=1 Tax=Thermobacillus sp. ZCTH02-B1 TaxID=1858795 RepID=UPI000B574467|nr:hypothetical protein [Thermobacillus sp. ZCTH02-B1]OUM96747.1 MAG: hypothetical protein A9Z00_03970 [Thermobacillus sp. ZCTH02-B1]
MTSIRMVPVLLSALVSGALLFGGWFVYRHYAVEQPLAVTFSDIEGAEASNPVVTDDRVTVEIKLDGTASLAEVHRNIRERAADVLGGRKLELVIRQERNEKLETIWSSALFAIAQAMETRRYADIPETLAGLEAVHPGLEAKAEMDESNVYITLKLEEAVKYVVLPRQPAVLGVWPDA